jgi:hypothetical protein
MKSPQSPEITEILLKIFTPGPLGLPVKFSWRVLTSWCLTGWVMGFGMLLIVVTSGGLRDPGMALMTMLISCPLALFFYGFIGLGLDLLKGNRLSRTGWVWYIYPFLAVFMFVIAMFVLVAGLCGVKGPERSNPQIKYSDLLQLITALSSHECIDDFGNPMIPLLLQENKLRSDEQALIAKITDLATSQPKQPLGKLLTDRELNTLTHSVGIPVLEQVHGIEVINIPANVY